MAIKSYWVGTTGAFAYDDTLKYPSDPAIDVDAFRTNGQALIGEAPSEDDHVVRYSDLKGIGYREGNADGAGVGSGEFCYWSAASVFTTGSCNALQTSIVVGVATAAIGAGVAGVLQFSGDLQNINFSFSAGRIGTFAYLGADGLPTENRPNGVGLTILRLGIIKATDELTLAISYDYQQL